MNIKFTFQYSGAFCRHCSEEMLLLVQRLALWAANGSNRLQDIRQGGSSGELMTFEGQAVLSAEDYPSFRSLTPTYSYPFFLSLHCVIAQAVSPFQLSLCGICGGQSATGTGFPPSNSAFPCQYHLLHTPSIYHRRFLTCQLTASLI